MVEWEGEGGIERRRENVGKEYLREWESEFSRELYSKYI